MTKKDYIMVASVIKSIRHFQCKTKQQKRVVDILASELADIFLTDNGKFREEKWWAYLNRPIVDIITKIEK